MWPFDLRGPVFLSVWIFGAVWAAIWAIAIRHVGRRPADRTLPEPELDGIVLGYLAGGFERAVAAAVTGLVQDGRVVVDERGRLAPGESPKRVVEDATYRGIVHDVPPPGLAGAIVRALAARPRSFDALVAAVRDEEHDLRRRVLADGLLVRRIGDVRALALVPAWLWVAVGIGKLGVGIARNRPVGLLFVLLMIAGAILVKVTVERARWIPALSRRAERIVRDARMRLRGLEATARTAPQMLSGDDAALAFAAFGGAVLAGATAGLIAYFPPSVYAAGATASLTSSATAPHAGVSSGCSSGCGTACNSCGGGGGCSGCGGCGGCS